jgi:hypothetical protein
MWWDVAGHSREYTPVKARPIRVQALREPASAGNRGNHRESDEAHEPRGIAPLPVSSAKAAVSPVTPEVAGSSPVAPAPQSTATGLALGSRARGARSNTAAARASKPTPPPRSPARAAVDSAVTDLRVRA